MKIRIVMSSLFLGILSQSGAVFASDHKTRAPAHNAIDPSNQGASAKDLGPCHHVLIMGESSSLNKEKGSTQVLSRLAKP